MCSTSRSFLDGISSKLLAAKLHGLWGLRRLTSVFFPTSLCRVLVFGCALPSAFSSSRHPSSNFPHTTYPHTTYPHTTYSHTTYPHTTYSHTTYSHTTYSHTPYSHTTYLHTNYSHTAGVALGDIDLHFAWQAWHLWHWAGSGDANAPSSPRHFAWQAWHLVTSTVTLRCRRGTW